jgi:hypothetical protein
MVLVVRGDTFEVCCTVPLFRVVSAMEYYFRARETTIEVSGVPSFMRKVDWILIRGQQRGKRTEIAVASQDYLYDAWVALVRAGAVPAGPPPPVSRLGPLRVGRARSPRT